MPTRGKGRNGLMIRDSILEIRISKSEINQLVPTMILVYQFWVSDLSEDQG